jgi:hypothetical protein
VRLRGWSGLMFPGCVTAWAGAVATNAAPAAKTRAPIAAVTRREMDLDIVAPVRDESELKKLEKWTANCVR